MRKKLNEIPEGSVTIDYEKVGQKLKSLRSSLGITQDRIATGLGTTVAFISNVENNRAHLNLRVLTYYADLCGVSVDSILNAGRPESGKYPDTALDQELLQVLSLYSPEEKEKLLKCLKIGKDLSL